MKKFFSIIAFSFALIAASSVPNEVNAQGTVMTASKNTHTNADTSNHVLQVVGNYDVVTVQVFGTKTSGTPAGTATLQGSLDGTNYTTIKTYPVGHWYDSTAFVTGYGVYTITNTTGTQSYSWTLD